MSLKTAEKAIIRKIVRNAKKTKSTPKGRHRLKQAGLVARMAHKKTGEKWSKANKRF